MVGLLGRILFMASSNRVFTIRDMGRESSPAIEEHQVIGKKPVLEFISPGLETITFSIRLDVGYGVIPEMELDKLRGHRDAGDILPFIIGGRYIGDYVIASLSEAHKVQDSLGVSRLAEVEVTLKESGDNGLLFGLF